MPLFRYIDAPEHLTDATFDFPSNPDPKKFEAVPEKPEKATTKTAKTTDAPSADEAEPENKE
jgi:hypothetical protein